jgi:hypothetical protein
MKCDHCNKPGASMRCSRCRDAVYCDAKCQRMHWAPHHQHACGSNANMRDADAMSARHRILVDAAVEQAAAANADVVRLKQEHMALQKCSAKMAIHHCMSQSQTVQDARPQCTSDHHSYDDYLVGCVGRSRHLCAICHVEVLATSAAAAMVLEPRTKSTVWHVTYRTGGAYDVMCGECHETKRQEKAQQTDRDMRMRLREHEARDAQAHRTLQARDDRLVNEAKRQAEAAAATAVAAATAARTETEAARTETEAARTETEAARTETEAATHALYAMTSSQVHPDDVSRATDEYLRSRLAVLWNAGGCGAGGAIRYLCIMHPWQDGESVNQYMCRVTRNPKVVNQLLAKFDWVTPTVSTEDIARMGDTEAIKMLMACGIPLGDKLWKVLITRFNGPGYEYKGFVDMFKTLVHALSDGERMDPQHAGVQFVLGFVLRTCFKVKVDRKPCFIPQVCAVQALRDLLTDLHGKCAVLRALVFTFKRGATWADTCTDTNKPRHRALAPGNLFDTLYKSHKTPPEHMSQRPPSEFVPLARANVEAVLERMERMERDRVAAGAMEEAAGAMGVEATGAMEEAAGVVEEECSICLLSLEDETPLLVRSSTRHFVCDHGSMFHETCIALWKRTSDHAGCPLCRAAIEV